MSWTPDRKDTLRRMWVEGKSSRQIAESLGDVTRNAVMGMVNRMGLMGNKDHNAQIKSAHGACRPIVTPADREEPVAITQPAAEPKHDPVPAPAPAPAPRPRITAQTPPRAEVEAPPAMKAGEPAAAVEETATRVVEPETSAARPERKTPEPVSRAANDDPAPAPEVPRQKLASRLLGPLRRAMTPERERPAAPAAYVSPGTAPRPAARERRPDWRTAVSMVEEITGQKYSPGAKGHRTSLVAIAAILGGGDPRSILPRDFPEPFVLRTMRSLAEKGIMIAGNAPEAWLDPDLGDLNFFIDMLVAEGVMKGSRTSSSPATLTA